jgi:hypothetical protein
MLNKKLSRESSQTFHVEFQIIYVDAQTQELKVWFPILKYVCTNCFVYKHCYMAWGKI